MRTFMFILFYGIVFTVYFLVNYYIFIRGWQSIPAESRTRTIYLIGFILLAGSFILGRIMERFFPGAIANIIVWTGSFWLAAMFYFFLLVVFIDIIRLANYALPFLGKIIPEASMPAFRLSLLKYSVTAVSVVLLAGHLNTLYPKFTMLDLTIPSKTSELKDIDIVLVSDIHLGTLTPKRLIQKRVDLINSLNPDMILLAGDILDEDLTPVIHLDLGSALKQLRAPLGVFGITGNHEYIGGVEPASEYLTNHGITLLRDSVVKINNSFYLAGREDRDINRFSGDTRLTVDELLKDTPRDLPIILMDHQPYELNKSAAAGVSLQVSGHTHHGQIWPINYITRAIFEISRGYGKVDGMHVYVSSGLGTWGPPVRLSSRPEIVFIQLRFLKE